MVVILLAGCPRAEEVPPHARPSATEASPSDPELAWVARVAEAAGFQLQPTEGGAPEIYREPSTFRMWAFVPDEPGNRRVILRREGYKRVGTEGGIELFSDGQRLTWAINGIYVWLSGVEGIDASTLGVTDLVQASTEFAWDGSFADDADRRDQLTQRVGQVACHDGTGDLLSEGSGDQSGPGPQPPDEDRPGTDLTGFSMARYASGSLELTFATKGAVPRALEPGQRLHLILSATPKGRGTSVAALRASLKNDRWTVWARSDDDDSRVPVTAEIAGNGLGLIVDAESVPRLMQGGFRWHAFSEWLPEPTKTASEIYTDYCPNSGFPIFEGNSS